MDLGLTGKRALVMASSQGLGLGIGEALAAEGVNVLLTGRTEELLRSNVASINAGDGGRASYVVADLAEADSAAQPTREAKSEIGGISPLRREPDQISLRERASWRMIL